MKTNLSVEKIGTENHAVRMIAISLLAALLLIMLTGCRSDSDAAGTSPGVSGIYALVSVDGKTLPCTLTHVGTSMSIQSGTFTITDDGKCVSSIQLILGTNRNITKVTHAQYTLSGNELTMKWERAGTTKGRVIDNHFTMNNEGMIFSYQK